MLFFFPRGVLDEILNLIELVSEDFPSYSSLLLNISKPCCLECRTENTLKLIIFFTLCHFCFQQCG